MTEDAIRKVLNEHDGAAGYARSMCPTCQTIHPCLIWSLATDALELHRLRAQHVTANRAWV